MTGPDRPDAADTDEPADDTTDERDEGFQPGGSREPNPDPETPGGTAATHHPPAEPQR